MFVLAVDTSSPAVTAAIVRIEHGAEVLVSSRAPLAARGHGELLSPSIARCLADAGILPADITAVVAGTGPGPFTGLRVGLVTAAAFADAVGAPTYGVCSLDGIGGACADEAALLVATDARRHEVYWAGYAYGRRVGGPGVAAPPDVPTVDLRAVAGAAAQVHDWPGLRRVDRPHPDPSALVRGAVERIVGQAPSEVLTPLYLRRPDAVVPGAPKAVTQ